MDAKISGYVVAIERANDDDEIVIRAIVNQNGAHIVLQQGDLFGIDVVDGTEYLIAETDGVAYAYSMDKPNEDESR